MTKAAVGLISAARSFSVFIVLLLCCWQPLEIGDDYCGEHGINHPIKGADPVSSVAAVTWSDDDVTSVAVATTGNHTVALVGSSSGHIKKVISANLTAYYALAFCSAINGLLRGLFCLFFGLLIIVLTASASRLRRHHRAFLVRQTCSANNEYRIVPSLSIT